MNKLSMIAAATIVFACFSVAFGAKKRLSYEYEKKYDKFENITLVKVSGFPFVDASESCAYVGSFYHTNDGDSITIGANAFALSVFTASKDWRFLRNNRLVILADTSKFSTDDTNYKGDVGSGYVFESMWAMIPLDFAKKMLNSTSIEFRFGMCESSFGPDAKSALQMMADSLGIR